MLLADLPQSRTLICRLPFHPGAMCAFSQPLTGRRVQSQMPHTLPQPPQFKASTGRSSTVVAQVSTEAAAGLMSSEDEFHEALGQAPIVVVDWMAKWCRKCIYLKPKLQKLFQEEFPGVPLVFIDVNAVPGTLVTGNGIRKMPTIAVYKEGKKISEHVAQETGTGSFQKVREIVQLALL
ncbi:hypothetical protein CVIRNUC_001392 [Coccomyxa viridis]|uniref:Thioredoxin domain-containing protein n=1 Tax=Coccomyxa viridis TaxID=1274662 RepID=A0AAV1HTI5_9CHLO|nr:hypothetical protein CVIRNUC_001392 [Coccomyxa viridis]